MLHGQDLMEYRLIRDRMDRLQAERARERLARQASSGRAKTLPLRALWAWLARARARRRRATMPAGSARCCDASLAPDKLTRPA